MKRFGFLLTLIISLTCMSCNSEKAKFDANLKQTCKSILQISNVSEDVMEELLTMYMEFDDEYVEADEDGSKVLSKIFDEAQRNGAFDEINQYKDEMMDSFSKMSNPPASRQKCYDDLQQLIDTVNLYVEKITTKPSDGFSFLEGINDTEELVSSALNSFFEQHVQYLGNIDELFDDIVFKHDAKPAIYPLKDEVM